MLVQCLYIVRFDMPYSFVVFLDSGIEAACNMLEVGVVDQVRKTLGNSHIWIFLSLASS